MSILIKGMEMPKKGSWVSLRVFPDGQCFLYSWCGNDFDFMEHLTAVPVPPHGDLIERNALFKKCEFVCTDDDEDIRAVRYSIIENTPAIIPAEEYET